MIAKAQADLGAGRAPTMPDADGARQALPEGAGRATSTAIPTRVTEMDALVAYLQMLGTLVDFKLYDDKPNIAEEATDGPTRRLREFARRWGLALLRRWSSSASSSMRCGPSRKQQFDEAARMPLRGGLSRWHDEATRHRRRSPAPRPPAMSGTASSELNTPLPRWWLWIFYATIVWALGYWIVYPAWPLVDAATRRPARLDSRAAVVDGSRRGSRRSAARWRRSWPRIAARARSPPTPSCCDFARAQGSVGLRGQLRAVPRRRAAAAPGYPNLNDDDWLWGGTLDEIHADASATASAPADDKTRASAQMPAFGRDGMLKPARSTTVADYVRSLSGCRPSDMPTSPPARQLFAENCAACHGDDGKGNRELGAPNLTDAIWLYGSRQGDDRRRRSSTAAAA